LLLLLLFACRPHFIAKNCFICFVLYNETKRTKRKKKNVLSFSTNPFYVSQSADLAVNYRGPYGSPIVDPIQLALNLLLEFKKALQLLSDFLLINTTTKVQKYQTQVLN
jgi:hypothetical protein